MRFTSRVMNALEGVGIALEAIKANKARAALTIMGVAVGVFVVVALTSIVRGVNESAARDIEAAGPTSFFVYRRDVAGFQACDGTDETCPERRNPQITVDEIHTLERVPDYQAIVAHVGSQLKYRYMDRVLSASTDGYTPNWIDVDGGDIAPGRSFTYAEGTTGAKVVILNDKLAQSLFQGSDPMGKTVYIEDQAFTVIGLYHYTMNPMGTPTSGGGGDSPRGIIPFETARRSGQFWMKGTNLIVKPRPGVALEEATDEFRAVMRGSRRLRPSQPDNFAVVTQDKLLKVFDKLFGTFMYVGIALSSVGLLVGGVGVVAIMMISVTERTREIGVRKALGATRATILWQFLVEAVVLTGLGATAGLVLGMLTALTVSKAFPSIPASTPLSAVIASLVASAVTGVAFGLLPALRASKLDPVVALRYE